MRRLLHGASTPFTLTALALAWFPTGCSGAPSIALAGAYFPVWLACGLIGAAGAIVARIVMVASGLARILPLQLFVCTSLGLAGAVAAWVAWNGI